MPDEAITQRSPANQRAWLDRLFTRMGGIYGTLWYGRWIGVPIEVMQAEWGDALKHFDLPAIGRAIEWCRSNHPLPPTLPEFVQACVQSRTPAAQKPFDATPRLGYDPKDARAKIAEITRNMLKPKDDPLSCFKEIITLAAEGKYTNTYGIRMAKESLGMEIARP